MARLTNTQRVYALETRGRWGRPARYGRAHFGFNLLGANDELAGIYQKATFADGRAISIRPFYWPSNPQTAPQQEWRATFAAAMSAWGALTTEQKQVYRDRAKHLPMPPHNLFVKEYLAQA